MWIGLQAIPKESKSMFIYLSQMYRSYPIYKLATEEYYIAYRPSYWIKHRLELELKPFMEANNIHAIIDAIDKKENPIDKKEG
jgi:hypothetical protein